MRLVIMTIAWVAGLLLGVHFTGSLPSVLWLLMAALGGGLAYVFQGRDAGRMALLFMLLTLGIWRYSFVADTSALAAYNDRGGVTVEGLVQSDPDVRDDRVQLRVRSEVIYVAGRAQPIDGLLLAQVPRTADVRYGDRVAVTGQLLTPPEFDTFSYADYLARSGIFSLMDNAALQVLSRDHGFALYATLSTWKDWARQTIRHYLPDPQAALLVGILLGDERGLDPELSDDFAVVGAAHVIAISGFNMVIITGVVMKTLGRVLQPRWAAFISISLVAIYTLFVGANPAVMRAALMSSLLVIAPLLKRRTYVPASLALAVMVMTMVDPNVLWSASLQLSFFSVLGMTVLVDPLSAGWRALLSSGGSSRVGRWLFQALHEPLIVTTAAVLATLPLTVLYFQRWSLVVVPVNVLLVPVQAGLLITGALATLAAIVSPSLAQLLYWIDMLFLSWTIAIVRGFADWTPAHIHYRVDPRFVWLFYVMLIGGAIIQAKQPDWALRLARTIRSRPVLNTVGLSGAALAVLMLAIFLSRPDGRLHLWFLDIGHNSAVLAQTPGGAHILVDGGRFPSRLLTAVGDRMPFYDRTIELLAITQPDAANIAALRDLVARYEVGVVLLNGQPNESDTYQQLMSELSGVETLIVRAGHQIALSDGTVIDVLHPSAQPALDDSMDATSLVLRLRLDQRSVLLTSDLSAEGQQALLASGQWPLADVMQVPKQGTARSLDTAFLMAAQPQLLLLQSDRANRRGDPDPDTLALLGSSPLFRTDEQGAIHVWTDGTGLWVQPEVQ